jgi:replicative DNA helicase
MTSDREEELALVAYILQNPQAMKLYGSTLAAHHFIYRPAKLLYSVLAKAITMLNGHTPSCIELQKLVEAETASMTLIEKPIYFNDLELLYELDTTAITGNDLHKLYVNREKQAIIEKISSLSAEEFAKEAFAIKRKLDFIQHSNLAQEQKCISIFSEEGISKTVTQVIEMQEGISTIPTGFTLVDSVIGGLRKGELAIIMASTGVGKTLMLFNLAVNMYKGGYRVLYFVLDNLLPDFAERVHACACHIPIPSAFEKLGRTKEAYEAAIRSELPYGKTNDRFLVQIWPPNRKKASEIKIQLAEIKERFYQSDIDAGVPPEKAGLVDIILVDYGELLLPETNIEQKHLSEAAIFDELTATAKEEDLPIVTATQTKRRDGSTSISITDGANSWAKFFTAAIVIGLDQNESERVLNEMRGIFLKCRRMDAVGRFVKFLIDQRMQRIIEEPGQTEARFVAEVAGQKRSREEELARIMKREETLDLETFDPRSFGINPEKVVTTQERVRSLREDLVGALSGGDLDE